MKSIKLLALVLLLNTGCRFITNRQFNSKDWDTEGDLATHPLRDAMLDDLLKSHKIKGQTKHQLIKLLGESDFDSLEGKGYLCYEIITEYGSGIDPLSSKNLTITFNKDSIATGYKVEEWKH